MQAISTLTEKISDAIFSAIAKDKLVLPTMPEMALRVREVADDQNTSIKQLSDIIGTDAALTARIIKVSNSAFYRGAKEIQNLNMALMRLGVTTTATLATGLAMEQMFQATSDMIDKRLRNVWSSSTEIAGISTILCKHYTKLRPDQASLAGLVHKIGVLPILAYAENHPALLKDSFTLESVIEAAHPNIGVEILSSWEFPQGIRNVPKAHLDFYREGDQADYADIVTVALMQSSPDRFKDVDFERVTAFDRLGLDPHIESTELEELDMAEGLNLFN